jgi:proteic killer suppression protein
MDILFAGDDLRRVCEQEKAAKRELGGPGAKKLQRRLADLRAASNVGELVAGRPHPLEGDREGQFALDLDGARRLAFEAADEPLPVNEAGRVDWPKVKRVRIVFIGDYHD